MAETLAQRVARNTAWFTVGSILQKLISFAYFTVIAMAFGDEGTGRYFYALAFTALFAVAADWGTSAVLTREIAKDRARGAALILPAFIMKAIFAVIVALAITAIAALLGEDRAARSMIAVATVVMVVDSMHLGLYAILRGSQRVHYEAIGLAVGQLTLAASGVGLLIALAGLHYDALGVPVLRISRDLNPVWLLMPYLVASVTNLAIATFGNIRERTLVAIPRASFRATSRHLLRTATPFAAAGGLARLYTYLDAFLLKALLGAGAFAVIGIYSVAFKITFAFQFIPLAFMGALYPAMSALAAHGRDQLRALFEQSLRALWTIALPMAFGLGMLAHRIVPLFYGDAFRSSVVPLIVLVAALPFIFANFPCGNLLNACDRQLVNTKLLAFATAVNVAANLLLIPRYGAMGAAISALVASIALFAANLVAVRRVVRYHARAVAAAFLRVTVACLAMSVAVLALRDRALPFVILTGALTYAIALIAVRGIQREDLATLRGYFSLRA